MLALKILHPRPITPREAALSAAMTSDGRIMKLVQLIYASTSNGIGPGDVQNILKSARANNGRESVTGLLCFSAERFLQCLEGSRQSVNAIYQKILQDERHTGPIILRYEEIDRRDFAHWSMAYVGDTEINRERILRYSGHDEFQPERMFGESARLLLLELAAGVAVRREDDQAAA